MAIDIRITDGISSSVIDKLNGIGNAARYTDERVKAMQSTLDKVNSSKVNTAASQAQAVTETQRKVSRATESAHVTYVKQLQKNRETVSKVFEDGLKDRETQQAKLISSIEKSAATLGSSKNTADAINRNTGAAIKQASASSLKQSQGMYNNLFGAHNLTTSSTSAKKLSDTINTVTGAGIKQSTATVQKQMQSMYESMFSVTANLPTSAQAALAKAQAASQAQAAPKKLSTYINQTQLAPPVESKTARAAQQASYDSLFGATSTASASAASSVNAASNAMKGVNSSANAASGGIKNLSKSMGDLDRSVSFLRSDGLRWAKVFGALSGVTLTAHALVGMADAYSRVQNRLSLVTESQQQNNALTQQIGQIANASRQPLEETAKTFARIDLAMKTLGRSQHDSLQITQNVAKALKLGGASAGESASALLQLSQAFNKGKLDGDEFRSVMENAPLLADKFAKKLGVTRGELLQLAPKGKITAKVMSEAILEATADIDKAFGKLKPTIAEAFTVMRTSATLFFGDLDKQTGITAAMSSAIMVLSKNLDKVAFVIAALAPILAVFIGRAALTGFAALGRYAVSAGASIGAIQSPITKVAIGLANMGRVGTAALRAIMAEAIAAGTFISGLTVATYATTTAMTALGAVARRAGAMMAAAFSFGNIILIITTLIAAVWAFGDRFIVSAKDGINARDVLLAAWDEFSGFMVYIFNAIFDAISAFFGSTVDGGMTTTEKLIASFNAFGTGVAVTIDAIITVLTNLWSAIKSVIYFLSDTIYNVFAILTNAIVSVVNVGIDAINGLGSAANWVLDKTGASNIVGNFGEIGKLAGMDFKTQFVDSLADFKQSDGALNAWDTIKDRVMEGAKKRAADRSTDAPLRGTGKDMSVDPAAKAKKGITREELLRRQVAMEEKTIATALRYGDAKAVTAKIEEVEEKLREKNFAKLSINEKAAFEALVRRREEMVRVGKAQDALFEVSNQAAEDQKRASQQAAKNMLSAGVIGQNQFTSAMQNASNKFNEATDSAYAYKKALTDIKEVSGLYGDEATGAKAVQEARQKAIDGNKATPDTGEIARLAIEKANIEKANSAYTSAMDTTIGAQKDNGFAINALNKAYDKGALSVQNYTNQMYGLRAVQLQLKNAQLGITDWSEPFRQGIYQLVAEMPTLGQSMADAVHSTLGNAIDNVSSAITNLTTDWSTMSKEATDALGRPASALETIEYTVGKVVKAIGQEMVNAIIKMGVQMAIQWAMKEALATAANASAVAQAAATGAAITAAMTPAATTASIATAGTSAVSGSAAFAASMASMLAVIPAFADGSDVIRGAGNSRSDSILARLSNGEMVMNANATKNNLSALRAMQSGATLSGGQGTSVQITVIVESDGTSTTTTKGQADSFSKELVPLVTGLVDKRLSYLSNQGQPLAR